MSLRACLDDAGLAAGARPGLQALSAADARRVSCANPRVLTGSVDLDEALAQAEPNAPRWDYGIGLASNEGKERVEWVEIHPATSGEVAAVLNKLRWLQGWLRRRHAACSESAHAFHWVATAGVHINPAHRRRLNAAGLRMPRQHLHL